jgi:dienelactone hydrolase
MKLLTTFTLAAVALLSPVTGAIAAVKTETVEYKLGSQTLKGFVAYDDAVTVKRPGVLVVPEWWGLDDYAKARAQQLAELGYVAFAADYYGDGKTTTQANDAAAMATPVRSDPGKFRALGEAALKELKARPEVDPQKVAAIGYCFGGAAVLELARGGGDVLGVVSFHGALATQAPAKVGAVKAKVLACHGADDPMVKPEEVAAFMSEMKEAAVDYSIIAYGGAQHSFTNTRADSHNIPGIKYDEKADKRSWEAMKVFFAELFK